MDKKPGQPVIISLVIYSGLLLFVVLYVAAAFTYPGGFDGHPEFRGFSWLHNYWCNLLNKNAVNGAVNEGRKFACAAMVAVCISLTILMACLPPLFYSLKKTVRVLQMCGITAMLLLSLLMLLPQHDLIINLSGFFLLIALGGTLTGLYRKKLWITFYLGLFCLVLIMINNFLYYTGIDMYYLPLVQKITFLFVWIWLIQLCRIVNRSLIPYKI